MKRQPSTHCGNKGACALNTGHCAAQEFAVHLLLPKRVAAAVAPERRIGNATDRSTCRREPRTKEWGRLARPNPVADWEKDNGMAERAIAVSFFFLKVVDERDFVAIPTQEAFDGNERVRG